VFLHQFRKRRKDGSRVLPFQDAASEHDDRLLGGRELFGKLVRPVDDTLERRNGLSNVLIFVVEIR
jgi:hypothetical protein